MQQKPSPAPPTYDEVVHGVSRAPAASSTVYRPVVYVHHGPTVQGPDVAYLKSPAGIAKIVEAVSEINHTIM